MLRDLTTIPFHNLTVLIGENDCGKSTILKALGFLLGKASQQDEDFYSLTGIEVNEFSLTGKFKIDTHNITDSIRPYIINENFTLKNIHKKSGV